MKTIFYALVKTPGIVARPNPANEYDPFIFYRSGDTEAHVAHALNRAYDAGRREAQAEMREALGIKP